MEYRHIEEIERALNSIKEGERRLSREEFGLVGSMLRQARTILTIELAELRKECDAVRSASAADSAATPEA